MARKRIVILISGRGSNMDALVASGLPATITAVISNVAQAPGLELARARGVVTAVVDHRDHGDRCAFDHALSTEIDRHAPDLVLLAGFMRVLTQGFVQRYRGRLLNIHPSLLPAFPGLHTHRRALEAGVRIHGCTVHFVSADLDQGAIVAQAAVPVLIGDTEEALAERVLREEHLLYPQVVRWFCENRLELREDGSVSLSDAPATKGVLISPALEVAP